MPKEKYYYTVMIAFVARLFLKKHLLKFLLKEWPRLCIYEILVCHQDKGSTVKFIVYEDPLGAKNMQSRI